MQLRFALLLLTGYGLARAGPAAAQATPSIDDLLNRLRQDAAGVKRAEEDVNRAQADLERANSITVLAETERELAGYATLHLEQARWTRRVGESQVFSARFLSGRARRPGAHGDPSVGLYVVELGESVLSMIGRSAQIDIHENRSEIVTALPWTPRPCSPSKL